jgi:hypothetical protein
MRYPPSLPVQVKARAFVAGNGELGVHPRDVPAFLAACRSDGFDLLGWELWIVRHRWDGSLGRPVPAAGAWCGVVPLKHGGAPAVVGGEGDQAEIERQLEAADFEAEVDAVWLPDLRVSFTLAG